MKRWCVYTPEVETVIPILDDGSGPSEWGCDAVEVEAETKADAIALGVRMMLNGSPREFSYCRDQRVDGKSPYTGVKAEEIQRCPVCGEYDCRLDDACVAAITKGASQ